MSQTSQPNISVNWSKKVKLTDYDAFADFIQRMANRLIAGFHQYGNPNPTKKYMTKAIIELNAYKKTGNIEHLYNVANYCHLEVFAPEHPKAHFRQVVDSVTRGKV